MKCKDYHFINLMIHVPKILPKIIHHRIHKKIERLIIDTKYDFRIRLGTREHVFSIQVSTQRSRDVNWYVEKLFDRIQYYKMIQILQYSEIDEKTIIIAKLYWQQRATIEVKKQTKKNDNQRCQMGMCFNAAYDIICKREKYLPRL